MVKYFGELREGHNIFEGSGGSTQNPFELFYLKYACKYYGTTTQLGWAVKFVHTFKGGLQNNSAHPRGGHKFMLTSWNISTCPPTPPPLPTVTVDNSLTAPKQQILLSSSSSLLSPSSSSPSSLSSSLSF